MSKVLIGYNTKEIDKKTREIIIKNLFSEDFCSGIPEKFYNSVKYKKFGKIQIIFSVFNKYKHRFKISGDTLINISGMIDNEKSIIKNSVFGNIEDLLLYKYLRSKKSFNKILTTLTGQYVIFIYSKKKDEVLIINDRLGLYPAYIEDRRESFVYSNKVEAMLSLVFVSKKINYDAVSDYLTIGSVQNRATFVSGINNLNKGEIFFKKRGGYGFCDKYYDFVYDDQNYSIDEYLERVNLKLTETVLRMYDFNPGNMIVGLTGGFDTRLINSILLENDKGYYTYTIDKTLEKEWFYDHKVKIDKSIANKFKDKFSLKSANIIDCKKINPKITGHWGGEIFGGDILSSLSYGNTTIDLPFFYKKIKKHLTKDSVEEYKKNIDRINSDNYNKRLYLYKVELGLTSFMNAFKNYMPMIFKRPNTFFYSVSDCDFRPFTSVDFLEIFLRVPISDIKDHFFYRKLIEKYYLKYYKDLNIIHNMEKVYAYKENKDPVISLLKIIDQKKVNRCIGLIPPLKREKKSSVEIKSLKIDYDNISNNLKIFGDRLSFVDDWFLNNFT